MLKAKILVLLLICAISTNFELSAQEKTYANSDGSTFVPKYFYPKFSWDTTPQYFMFQDKNRLLTPKEVAFIAPRTDFICIEKSHGKKRFGAAELGAKAEAKAFKKANPDIKVLFYFNATITTII